MKMARRTVYKSLLVSFVLPSLNLSAMNRSLCCVERLPLGRIIFYSELGVMGTSSISRNQHWVNSEWQPLGDNINKLGFLYSKLHVVSLLRIVRPIESLTDTQTLPLLFRIEALCVGLNWICHSFPVRDQNLGKVSSLRDQLGFGPGSKFVWCAWRKNCNCSPLLFWKRRRSWWMWVDSGFLKDRPGGTQYI